MKTVDFSIYFVTYNFIIGVLLMLSSEKIGAYAGHLMGAYHLGAARLTRIGFFTIGATVAVLMVGVYVAGHLLHL
jgi:hypothetical protein